MNESYRIGKILVPEEALLSQRPYDIVEANVVFVNALLYEGYHLRDELPVEAMMSYHVDFYYAQVYNGGHEQFVANSRWQRAVNDDVETGLRVMEAWENLDLFQRARRYIDLDQMRLDQMKARGGFNHDVYGQPDGQLSQFDKEMYALGKTKELYFYNSAFLKTRCPLTTCPQKDHAAALTQLARRNPAYEARAEQAEIAKEERRLENIRRGRLIQKLCAGIGRHYEPDGRFLIYDARNNETGSKTSVYVVSTAQGQVGLIEDAESVLLVSFPDGDTLAVGDPAELLRRQQ